MPPHIDPQSLWLILRVQNGFFAVPCHHVQSIMVLTDIVSIPNLPDYVRGIINHHGQVVHLIDMRIRLGIPSLNNEVSDFIEMMNAREQDHIDWVNTLNNCINEEKEFTLVTDPCRCKFGQWYYQFLPTVTDNELKSLLESFEKPHSDIHGSALKVKQFLFEGKKSEAINLIKEKRNYELPKMMDLFTKLKEFHKKHHREVTIILESAHRQFALIVDEVTTISCLLWDNWQSMDEVAGDVTAKYMSGIAEIPDSGLPVVVLDVTGLST
ncbi:MAG: hypothetical protein QG599_565 [Pseudomonadota bacterium]|nr:hypothetical protein [Pseudomonadota bacterium]